MTSRLMRVMSLTIATVVCDAGILIGQGSVASWLDEPKPSDAGKGGEHLYGYLVHFRVDARNRFGGYTGKQNHAALIRNGDVIKGFGFGY